MKVLVINCGSSSLKYQLIDSETESVLAKGLCERIGVDGRITHKPTGKEKVELEIDQPNHEVSIELVLKYLVDPEHGVISSMDEIDAIGHRVVHGGEKFEKPVLITEKVVEELEEVSDLAPLHNPANITGIRACKAVVPNVPMVAVFDTGFHQTLPRKAFLYGVPRRYYEEDSFRRYGFHGTSHSYVSKKVAEVLGKDVSELKTIVCHLGGGASICAVDGGISVDTSMGMTPLAGLVMGTRGGNVDPSFYEYIGKKYNMTIHEITDVLNKESGVYGISGGLSSDFRDLLQAMNEGNEKAKDAVDVFCYTVAKFIGSYITVMNGVDVIVFTAGIGENSPVVRKMILEYFGYLGLEVNDEVNDATYGEVAIISKDTGKVKAMVVPTNEELMICRETVALVNN